MTEPIDVLIVDDNKNLRVTLMEILRQDGYSVRSVSSGEEAVELCHDYRFRVIFMDMRMPGIDGINTFREIRRHCKQSQIILMSAYASEELAHSALDAGLFAFLQKPLDIEAVTRLIAEVMSVSVLLVGFDERESEEFEQAIIRSGFRVSRAARVEEAVQLLAQIHYDALLVDNDSIKQPQQALAELCELTNETRVILACGAASPDDLSGQPTLDKTMTVMRKPLSLEGLMTALEGVKCERIGMPPPSRSLSNQRFSMGLQLG